MRESVRKAGVCVCVSYRERERVTLLKRESRAVEKEKRRARLGEREREAALDRRLRDPLLAARAAALFRGNQVSSNIIGLSSWPARERQRKNERTRGASPGWLLSRALPCRERESISCARPRRRICRALARAGRGPEFSVGLCVGLFVAYRGARSREGAKTAPS